MADVIAIFVVSGGCSTTIFSIMADLIAMVAGVIAT